MRWVMVLLVVACGGKPADKPKACDGPPASGPMSQAQCTCAGGNVQLPVGRAVELHCEPNETELGNVKLDDRAGWCCKPH